VAWPFEIADLNCERHSYSEICDSCAIEPESKAQYYLVMLALIGVGQLEQDKARVQR
jgi:hypothetical protein